MKAKNQLGADFSLSIVVCRRKSNNRKKQQTASVQQELWQRSTITNAIANTKSTTPPCSFQNISLIAISQIDQQQIATIITTQVENAMHFSEISHSIAKRSNVQWTAYCDRARVQPHHYFALVRAQAQARVIVETSAKSALLASDMSSWRTTCPPQIWQF